jgi:hypothetical protein
MLLVPEGIRVLFSPQDDEHKDRMPPPSSSPDGRDLRKGEKRFPISSKGYLLSLSLSKLRVLCTSVVK